MHESAIFRTPVKTLGSSVKSGLYLVLQLLQVDSLVDCFAAAY